MFSVNNKHKTDICVENPNLFQKSVSGTADEPHRTSTQLN